MSSCIFLQQHVSEMHDSRLVITSGKRKFNDRVDEGKDVCRMNKIKGIQNMLLRNHYADMSPCTF